jgi:hypothetical protein
MNRPLLWIGSAAAAGVGYFAIHLGWADGNAFTAVGTVGAAVAAAFAAGSARDAASQSEASASRATEALGRILAPQLTASTNARVHQRRYTGSASGGPGLFVTNHSPHAAVDIVADVQIGMWKAQVRFPRLEGKPEQSAQGSQLEVTLDYPDDRPELGQHKVTLRYRDESRLLRWRYEWSADLVEEEKAVIPGCWSNSRSTPPTLDPD